MENIVLHAVHCPISLNSEGSTSKSALQLGQTTVLSVATA
jgi:hypothetical protein